MPFIYRVYNILESHINSTRKHGNKPEVTPPLNALNVNEKITIGLLTCRSFEPPPCSFERPLPEPTVCWLLLHHLIGRARGLLEQATSASFCLFSFVASIEQPPYPCLASFKARCYTLSEVSLCFVQSLSYLV